MYTPVPARMRPSLPTPFRWRRLRRSTLLAAVLLSGLLGPLVSVADPMKLGGTGSALGVMQHLIEAFQRTDPSASFVVVPNLGTAGGMKALAAGAIHLALTNRPPRGEEVAQGLVARAYGKTPFVLVTSKPGVSGLTVQQLAEIYAGKQRTWPDGSPIRLILRPANDGDTSILASFSTAMKQALDLAMAQEEMIIALTDQDSVNNVERLPGALGTASLALLLSERRSLTPLALDGVRPSVETLAEGSYPYMKTMYLVTKGSPDGPVARFIDFVASPAGRTILRANGHWVGDEQRPAN